MAMTQPQMDLFALAEQRLSWVEQRQALLARNIANADTPGWRTRDVKPFDQLVSGSALDPVRTDAAHMVPSSNTTLAATTFGSEHAPDGNTVALDTELSKIADTESTHQLVTQLYMKYQGLFRTALGH
jgi:flagellar basal-body rod protein FlgB